MFPGFHKWEAPNQQFLVGIFQQINHPAIGVLPFMEPPCAMFQQPRERFGFSTFLKEPRKTLQHQTLRDDYSTHQICTA